ncbi:hypothetical protein ABE288_09550 [Bacillus salipaludis]|uniref:hypothetical protein n=1 Tax=Bacillus salipaludis TaxID=2547811 RepID=UPI003D233D77
MSQSSLRSLNGWSSSKSTIKLGHRRLESATLNVNQCRKALAEMASVYEHDLRLISFSEIASHDDRYKVYFKTANEKFTVKADKNGAILELKRKNITDPN